MSKKKKKLGLVLAGGGARGAYEAGIIHYLRTQLSRQTFRHNDFAIICGSSVGAINACFMAATAHDPLYQGNRCYELWSQIKQADIYKRDVLSFASFVTGSLYSVAKNIFTRRIDYPNGLAQMDHFKGLLDTKPFVPFLKKVIPWQQISINIANRYFEAVTVTATNIFSGKLELFIEKHPELPYTGDYIWHDTKMQHFHAMASAAIPMVFPTVKVHRDYYADGGLRLNTPLSPAIQLGAEKILILGPHNVEEASQIQETDRFIEPTTPPSLGLLLGKILSSIFIDKLDYDIEQLQRINRLIDWGEAVFGDDFIQKINSYLDENKIVGDIANRGLKKIEVMRISPSRDIRELFSEAIHKSSYLRKEFTSFEKTLLKLLDVDIESGKDFLSYILFYPEYIKMLLELGFEDAKQNHDQLLEFFS